MELCAKAPRCWFDEEKCRAGLEALTFYRKNYNERLQEFTDKPLHDWSSHGADEPFRVERIIPLAHVKEANEA